MGKDQEFLEAARNGNRSYIEKVLTQKAKRVGPLASLRRGTGINAQDSGGCSALHHACLNGHTDIVSLLLAHDAAPNLPDSRGSSPLHLAAWAGEAEIVRMLLSHPYRPANPNLQTIENETPLHCAAQHGHIEALAVLLHYEADPNMKNARGETPLDLAAQYGRLEAVEMLLQGHPELLAPLTNIATERHHPTANANKTRHTSPLPQSGSISTPSPSSPSMMGSIPNTPTRCIFPHTCLHLASRNGHKQVVETLLAAGVSVNLLTPSGSALHEAALCGKESVVKTLLKSGIDLNATDAEGRTALDILKEFPPHVTKHIIAVINNFRNQMDTDDGEEVIYRHHQPAPPQRTSSNSHNSTAINSSTSNSHYQKQQHNNHYHFNSNNHLLNHSHSMQTSSFSSSGNGNGSASRRYAPASISFNGGKSLDSGLQPDDMPTNNASNATAGPSATRFYHDINSPVHSNSNYSQNDMGVSPSSSMSSFEPASVSPRSRSSNGGLITFGGGNQMQMSTFAPQAPPKKPPRKNLSVSPTHPGQSFTYNSPNHQTQHNSRKPVRSPSNDSPYSHQSHGSVGGMSFDETQLRERQRNEKIYASARESSRSAARLAMSTSNDMLEQYSCNDQNLENIVPNSHPEKINSNSMKRPIPAPRKPGNVSKEIINCENPTLKSYNPNRKLKRNRNSYSLSLNEKERFSLSSDSNSDTKQNIPQSPTHYKQPPTPDHPPPSASTAERQIHEKVRPLSMEYKRRSALMQQSGVNETSTSPPKGPIVSTSVVPMDYMSTNTVTLPVYPPANIQGSSGSLSSCISGSDHSLSTDCVEEFIGDAPFAGLLKGSTANVKMEQRLRPPIATKPKLLKQATSPQQPPKILEVLPNLNGKENGKSEETKSQEGPSKGLIGTKEEPSSIDEATKEVDSKTPDLNFEESSLLSPFNAEEARKKISEIIESFGSGILNSDLTPSNDIDWDFEDLEVPQERHELALRLRKAGLLHLERMLFENGYDNYNFVNGVFDESDIDVMLLVEPDVSKLIKFIETLPQAEFQSQKLNKQQENMVHKDDSKGVATLQEWLHSIQLAEYVESFHKHLYNTIDSVCGVWDVELQTVLEINKVGHRRRILQSVAYIRQMRDPKGARTPLSEYNDLNKIPVITANGNGSGPPKEHIATIHARCNNSNYRKSRPAPPPPKIVDPYLQQEEGKDSKPQVLQKPLEKQGSVNQDPKPTNEEKPLQIRNPSELMLGLPSHLCTKWRHTAKVLLNEQIKYEVYYLGSTVVKELRGTESTRKSIQKFKHDGRSTPTQHPNHSSSKQLLSFRSNSTQKQQKRLLICLAISCQGVEFFDVNSRRTICEHEIQNINCACQDSEDLRHFAYITKENELHYCHVFRVESSDLATEIILTLGQAFEVAYQTALRDGKQASVTVAKPNAAQH